MTKCKCGAMHSQFVHRNQFTEKQNHALKRKLNYALWNRHQTDGSSFCTRAPCICNITNFKSNQNQKINEINTYYAVVWRVCVWKRVDWVKLDGRCGHCFHRLQNCSCGLLGFGAQSRRNIPSSNKSK